MKTELSAYELGILARELHMLVDAKIDNVYQNKDEFYLQFHKTSYGKLIFYIKLPSLCFISSTKSNIPEKPSGFCMGLRKHLSGTKLSSLKQHNFERILELDFSAKDKKLKLIIELFSTGNIILIDDKDSIIISYRTQAWSSRIIKAGHEYVFPPSKADLFILKEEEFGKIISASSRDSIVKTLAIDLGLGGIYSEEILKRAEVAKETPSTKLAKTDISKIYSQIHKIKGEKSAPRAHFKDGVLQDIVPIEMHIYDGHEFQNYSSFNEAIALWSSKFEKPKNENGRAMKLRRIAYEQEKNAQELEAAVVEETRKGELIYENYAIVKEILEKITELRKKEDWARLKEKIMGKYSQVREIHEKKGEIVVEFQ